MPFTRYCLGVAVGLFLSASTAQAQLISDPTQATAARDTLFQQATQLQQQATLNSATFKPTIKRAGRRHVLKGASPKVKRAMSSDISEAESLWSWRHTTIRRRTGVVEERYQVRQANQILLNERRLNGTVTWLKVSIPKSPTTKTNIYKPRHKGLYMREGYLVFDGKNYVLPAATN